MSRTSLLDPLGLLGVLLRQPVAKLGAICVPMCRVVDQLVLLVV